MLGLQIVGREMLIMNSTDAFTLAVREHDRAVRERGLNLWVGSEPTFTDRYSQAPEWLSSALGVKRKHGPTNWPRSLLRICRAR